MGVKAVNDTVGSDSLIPTLSVLGTYQKLENLHKTHSSSRAASKKAEDQLKNLSAQTQVRDALNTRNLLDTLQNLMLVGVAEKPCMAVCVVYMLM